MSKGNVTILFPASQFIAPTPAPLPRAHFCTPFIFFSIMSYLHLQLCKPYPCKHAVCQSNTHPLLPYTDPCEISGLKTTSETKLHHSRVIHHNPYQKYFPNMHTLSHILNQFVKRKWFMTYNYHFNILKSNRSRDCKRLGQSLKAFSFKITAQVIISMLDMAALQQFIYLFIYFIR